MLHRLLKNSFFQTFTVLSLRPLCKVVEVRDSRIAQCFYICIKRVASQVTQCQQLLLSVCSWTRLLLLDNSFVVISPQFSTKYLSIN